MGDFLHLFRQNPELHTNPATQEAAGSAFSRPGVPSAGTGTAATGPERKNTPSSSKLHEHAAEVLAGRICNTSWVVVLAICPSILVIENDLHGSLPDASRFPITHKKHDEPVSWPQLSHRVAMSPAHHPGSMLDALVRLLSKWQSCSIFRFGAMERPWQH